MEQTEAETTTDANATDSDRCQVQGSGYDDPRFMAYREALADYDGPKWWEIRQPETIESLAEDHTDPRDC